jgi:hypothetical protein
MSTLYVEVPQEAIDATRLERVARWARAGAHELFLPALGVRRITVRWFTELTPCTPRHDRQGRALKVFSAPAHRIGQVSHDDPPGVVWLHAGLDSLFDDHHGLAWVLGHELKHWQQTLLEVAATPEAQELACDLFAGRLVRILRGRALGRDELAKAAPRPVERRAPAVDPGRIEDGTPVGGVRLAGVR